jgi:hypothetical protein
VTVKRKRLRFPGFSILVDPRWSDTTQSLQDPNAPFTVEDREKGVGALQFSAALYRSGECPAPTPQALLDLVKDFGRRRNLGSPSDAVMFQEKVVGAAASYRIKGDFVRVWYVSDGKNILLITYLSEWAKRFQEKKEYERIPREVSFGESRDRK